MPSWTSAEDSFWVWAVPWLVVIRTLVYHVPRHTYCYDYDYYIWPLFVPIYFKTFCCHYLYIYDIGNLQASLQLESVYPIPCTLYLYRRWKMLFCLLLLAHSLSWKKWNYLFKSWCRAEVSRVGDWERLEGGIRDMKYAWAYHIWWQMAWRSQQWISKRPRSRRVQWRQTTRADALENVWGWKQMRVHYHRIFISGIEPSTSTNVCVHVSTMVVANFCWATTAFIVIVSAHCYLFIFIFITAAMAQSGTEA